MTSESFMNRIAEIRFDLVEEFPDGVDEASAFDIALSLKDCDKELWNFAKARIGADDIKIQEYIAGML